MKKTKKRVQQREQGITEGTLVWRTGLSGVPPNSVRCTRKLNSKLTTFENSGRPLRYNSLDCPVRHQTVFGDTPDCPCASGATATSHATVDCNTFNAHLRAQRIEHARVAHRTAYRACPVYHRTVSSAPGRSDSELASFGNPLR